jgi:hypothetical protein
MELKVHIKLINEVDDSDLLTSVYRCHVRSTINNFPDSHSAAH